MSKYRNCGTYLQSFRPYRLYRERNIKRQGAGRNDRVCGRSVDRRRPKLEKERKKNTRHNLERSEYNQMMTKRL